MAYLCLVLSIHTVAWSWNLFLSCGREEISHHLFIAKSCGAFGDNLNVTFLFYLHIIIIVLSDDVEEREVLSAWRLGSSYWVWEIRMRNKLKHLSQEYTVSYLVRDSPMYPFCKGAIEQKISKRLWLFFWKNSMKLIELLQLPSTRFWIYNVLLNNFLTWKRWNIFPSVTVNG